MSSSLFNTVKITDDNFPIRLIDNKCQQGSFSTLTGSSLCCKYKMNIFNFGPFDVYVLSDNQHLFTTGDKFTIDLILGVDWLKLSGYPISMDISYKVDNPFSNFNFSPNITGLIQ